MTLAELRWLEETPTHGNQVEWRIWLIFSCILVMATGNNILYCGNNARMRENKKYEPYFQLQLVAMGCSFFKPP
jgi:hypothetical protein